MGAPRELLSPSQHRTRRRYGLVGARVTLYRSSPTFKAQIDALAMLLEPMIDGLAAQAADADRHHLQRLAGMQMLPPLDPEAIRLMFEPDSEMLADLDRAARDSHGSAGGKETP